MGQRDDGTNSPSRLRHSLWENVYAHVHRSMHMFAHMLMHMSAHRPEHMPAHISVHISVHMSTSKQPVIFAAQSTKQANLCGRSIRISSCAYCRSVLAGSQSASHAWVRAAARSKKFWSVGEPNSQKSRTPTASEKKSDARDARNGANDTAKGLIGSGLIPDTKAIKPRSHS